MQILPDLFRFIRCITIVLASSFILAAVLPVSSVHADDVGFGWVKKLGGTSDEYGMEISVDSGGNIYIGGYFSGIVDFDPGPGTYNRTSKGLDDIFISKLDRNGNFLWVKTMGGIFDDYGIAISLDRSGNVYITGEFQDTVDFDPGQGTSELTAGGIDIFVTKLDSNGGFLWAKAMGGPLFDGGEDISIDGFGNVYTTGSFQGTADFDPAPGTTESLISAGGYDIYISKLDNDGNYVWAKRFGGSSSGDHGNGISVDTSGNIHTTGTFSGTVDFDPNVGSSNLSSAGGTDIFISKLDNNGNYVWAGAMGGSSSGDYGHAISVDAAGNIYTTGYFMLTADFDPAESETFELTCKGERDIFISKLNSDGNFLWTKAMGGALNEYGIDISLDSADNPYITGGFYGTVDFDPAESATFELTSKGARDIFISKLDSDGTFAWAKSMGGISNDFGRSISVDTLNNIYSTGYFSETVDFNPGSGIFNLTSTGGDDIFVIRLDDSNFPWPIFLPAILGKQTTAPL